VTFGRECRAVKIVPVTEDDIGHFVMRVHGSRPMTVVRDNGSLLLGLYRIFYSYSICSE